MMTDQAGSHRAIDVVVAQPSFDAAQLGRPCVGGPDDGKHFVFGLGSKEHIADSLRELATAVERGDIVLQEARQITRVKHDDFMMRSLILRYAERLHLAGIPEIKS
jgi:hypothetical protein